MSQPTPSYRTILDVKLGNLALPAHLAGRSLLTAAPGRWLVALQVVDSAAHVLSHI